MSAARPKLSHAVALLLACALAGCAQERVREARSAARELVGKPVQTLVACAGKPDRIARGGDGERLSYFEGSGWADASGADDPTLSRDPSQGGARRPSVAARWCRMDVLVSDGVIRSVRFSGQSGGVFGRGEECADLLRACPRGGP
ncbi:MAG: hypothetical protein JNK11_14640 [Alphaproteobacteria bacterium]|nr:hypothetical protein [Alphaproteobacteria bacterium]